MNTFSLNNVETLRQSITNWYAQRNAHFPLNICGGQENEHIFLKKMLLNIQSVDNKMILPRKEVIECEAKRAECEKTMNK